VQGKQNQRVRLAGYFGFRPTHKPGRACGPTLLMVPVALIISGVAVMLGRFTFAHHAKLEARRGEEAHRQEEEAVLYGTEIDLTPTAGLPSMDALSCRGPERQWHGSRRPPSFGDRFVGRQDLALLKRRAKAEGFHV
jgi:hypothetical protein